MFGKKKRNTLFVDEITSIGAVSAGDDPEAEIVFWKKKPDDDQGALWTNHAPLIVDTVPTPSIVQPAIRQIRTITESPEAREARLDRLEKSLMPKEPVETIEDHIIAKLNRWSQDELWSRYGKPGQRGITAEKIRAELWATEQGNQIAALIHDEGAKPYAGSIRKSGTHKNAWTALDTLPAYR